MICPHCGKDTEVVLNIDTLKLAWFEVFWQLFPRKVSRLAALKAWKKAATSEAIKDEIMAGLERLRNSKSWGIDTKFIPHAATWLNGRRWEDEQAARGQTPAARVIACELCGDSGIVAMAGKGTVEGGLWKPGSSWFERCSCARGKLPGLVIPQGEEIDSTPF